jgi:hypothetical protein
MSSSAPLLLQSGAPLLVNGSAPPLSRRGAPLLPFCVRHCFSEVVRHCCVWTCATAVSRTCATDEIPGAPLLVSEGITGQCATGSRAVRHYYLVDVRHWWATSAPLLRISNFFFVSWQVFIQVVYHKHNTGYNTYKQQHSLSIHSSSH